jgi:hypothetical protein
MEVVFLTEKTFVVEGESGETYCTGNGCAIVPRGGTSTVCSCVLAVALRDRITVMSQNTTTGSSMNVKIEGRKSEILWYRSRLQNVSLSLGETQATREQYQRPTPERLGKVNKYITWSAPREKGLVRFFFVVG